MRNLILSGASALAIAAMVSGAPVLSAFPFDKYDVAAWTIENNTADTEIPALMQSKGYRRIEAIGVDDVYIRAAG